MVRVEIIFFLTLVCVKGVIIVVPRRIVEGGGHLTYPSQTPTRPCKVIDKHLVKQLTGLGLGNTRLHVCIGDGSV